MKVTTVFFRFIFPLAIFSFFYTSSLLAQHNTANEKSKTSVPPKFISTGIGGGGGLFSPSINPLDDSEYYTVCDLGALFHTKNGGDKYEYVPFTEVSGIIFSKISFTNDNNIRYTLKWDEPSYAARPAKTTDAGVTWNLLEGDSQEWEDKYFIYADFNNPNRVIWSTYDNIWLSDDGGLTDKLIYTGDDADAGVLLSGVYFDGDNIYFGTNDGVLVSNDGGQSVIKANYSGIPNDERIMGFGAGTANGLTRFFALTAGDGDIWCDNLGSHYWETIRGVYAMDNMSGTWTKKMNGIDISKDWAVYLSMATNDPNTCYIAGGTEVPYEKPFVMKTSDGGDSWQDNFITNNNQNVHTGYQGYQGDFDYWWGGYAMGFTVNPLNSNQAIITDLGYIHQTTDGGNTWHQKYLNSEDENDIGTPTPKKKSYRGIGMEQTSVWQVHWLDEQNVFGCFTDIQGIRSTDAGNSWSMNYEGHDLNTLYHMVKHNSEDIWFASTSAVHDMYETTYIYDYTVSPSWKKGKVLITKDKGASFQTLRDFETPVIWVETDPNNDDVLYASVISPDDNGGIWKATNISDPVNVVWTQLPSPENTNIGRPHNIHVLDDGTIVLTWAVRNFDNAFQDGSGVFISNDGGNTWLDRSHDDMRYWTQDIVIDPFDEDQNTWYVGVWSAWGGNGNNLGRLWRTRDRGISWEPMTAPQQFHRVYSVTVDPKDQETMYLTTETEGLWVTNNKSANNPYWELVKSYPYHAPRRVFFNPYNQDELWVASFGGGMMYGSTTSNGVLEFDVVNLPDITGECSVSMPIAPTASNQEGNTVTATTTTVFPITDEGTTEVIWSYDDGNGNIIEQSQNVIITTIDNTLSSNNSSLSVNASGYNYQWIDCENGNLEIIGETNQEFTPTISGNYAVEISSDDCSVVSDCIDVTITSIDQELLSAISVFPNPTSQNLQIDNKGQLNIEHIKLYNNIGKLTLSISGNRARIDIASIPQGVYTMELKLKNQVLRKKIIISMK